MAERSLRPFDGPVLGFSWGHGRHSSRGPNQDLPDGQRFGEPPDAAPGRAF